MTAFDDRDFDVVEEHLPPHAHQAYEALMRIYRRLDSALRVQNDLAEELGHVEWARDHAAKYEGETS